MSWNNTDAIDDFLYCAILAKKTSSSGIIFLWFRQYSMRGVFIVQVHTMVDMRVCIATDSFFTFGCIVGLCLEAEWGSPHCRGLSPELRKKDCLIPPFSLRPVLGPTSIASTDSRPKTNDLKLVLVWRFFFWKKWKNYIYRGEHDSRIRTNFRIWYRHEEHTLPSTPSWGNKKQSNSRHHDPPRLLFELVVKWDVHISHTNRCTGNPPSIQAQKSLIIMDKREGLLTY